MNIPNMKTAWRRGRTSHGESFDLIEENLRLVYDPIAGEELPVPFEELLSKLRQKEAKS